MLFLHFKSTTIFASCPITNRIRLRALPEMFREFLSQSTANGGSTEGQETPEQPPGYWGTGQVIILAVSTQTSLTDPSATGRERQFSVPSQSVWLKHASHSFLGVLHAAIVNPNTKASNIFMKFIPLIALRSVIAHQTRARNPQPPSLQ